MAVKKTSWFEVFLYIYDSAFTAVKSLLYIN